MRWSTCLQTVTHRSIPSIHSFRLLFGLHLNLLLLGCPYKRFLWFCRLSYVYAHVRDSLVVFALTAWRFAFVCCRRRLERRQRPMRVSSDASSRSRSRSRRAATSRLDRLWDYGVIPYEIDSNFSGKHSTLRTCSLTHSFFCSSFCSIILSICSILCSILSWLPVSNWAHFKFLVLYCIQALTRRCSSKQWGTGRITLVSRSSKELQKNTTTSCSPNDPAGNVCYRGHRVIGSQGHRFRSRRVSLSDPVLEQIDPALKRSV